MSSAVTVSPFSMSPDYSVALLIMGQPRACSLIPNKNFVANLNKKNDLAKSIVLTEDNQMLWYQQDLPQSVIRLIR